MGTTYTVMYFDEPLHRDFRQSIDSLLVLVNKAINTYDPSSEISRFNQSKRGIRFESKYFREILSYAKRIHKESNGAFDPTVMPLINAWGFGPEKRDPPDSTEVDSLMKFVGFDKVKVGKKKLRKKSAGVAIDMGGIGQGYGADVIFRFLRSKGIQHMLVELGGEGMAYGKNLKRDGNWTIGILDPNSTRDNQFFKAYVALKNQSFTTSGNYFNYKVIDGRKFGHTINPSTGYPVRQSLLSASVFSDDCTSADAMATAFMVMGTNKAIEFVKTHRDIDAIFFYSNDQGGISTYVSDGIKGQVTLEE
jgi:thiamine biosynthesis lipoprotein